MSVENRALSLLPKRRARPDVRKFAALVLGDNLSIDPASGDMRLWHMGRWSTPQRFRDVMRRVNTRLKQLGQEQLVLDPSWEVPREA